VESSWVKGSNGELSGVMGSQGKSRRVKRVEGNQNVSREINMFQGSVEGVAQ
jgi:hypothetical protein